MKKIGKEAKLREKVVQYMYDMANVEWTPGQEMNFGKHCNSPSLVYKPGQRYLGQMYNAGGNGIEVFLDALDAENTYVSEDTSWCGPGNSCSSSVRRAWQQISPNVEYQYTVDMMPCFPETGVIAVGNIRWETYDGNNTSDSVLKETPKADVMEAYALTLPGDGMMRHSEQTGGHALMVTLEPTVVRDTEGNIDPDQSFLYMTDQNNTINNTRSLPSSWKVDAKVAFSKVYADGYLPVTIPELREEETVAPDFQAEGVPAGQDLLTTGVKGLIKSNYRLVSVTAELSKAGSSGELVTRAVRHPYTKDFDLTELAAELMLRELPPGEYFFKVVAATGLGSDVVAEVAFRTE